MSPAHNGLNAYRQTQVQSRTPLELVVMLYDGALKSMTAAWRAWAEASQVLPVNPRRPARAGPATPANAE